MNAQTPNELFRPARRIKPAEVAAAFGASGNNASLSLATKVDAERFWSYVERRPGGQCWPWKASAFNASGYGQTHVINPLTGKKSATNAHRVAYELAHNELLTSDAIVMHADRCTTRLCCRPSHLAKGTKQQNTADAARLGRMGKRKLTPADACAIVALYRAGKKPPELSKRFGVTPQAIVHVLAGRTWSKHTGLPPRGPALKRSAQRQGQNLDTLEAAA
jgi:hypothetical protein